MNAKFVAERQEKPTDPIKTEDDSGTITIPEDVLEKLRAALKIRNLTAINNLAKQLVESGETEIGELIGKHARAFDFNKLSELAENQ